MTRHTYFRRFQTRRQAQGVLAVIAALVIAANRGPREWLFAIPVKAAQLADERVPQLLENLFDRLG